uniref:Uncharacterized protein n=2 Tax=Parascaris univalens TaxID=6257 RepID=A0A914ZJM8_PARUN
MRPCRRNSHDDGAEWSGFTVLVMLYGVVIVIAFIYIAIRVHIRLKERGEEGLPIVGDLLNVLCGIRDTSNEVISTGTTFNSKENISQMPNAQILMNDAEPFFPQEERPRRIITNSAEMDSSSSDTAGEQETAPSGEKSDPSEQATQS